MRPQDILFFLNAHGSRDHATVSGGGLSEHALRHLIGSVPARQALVLIEACQSGSFASLAHPGDRRRKTIVGAFSSDANEPSWNDACFRKDSFTHALTAAV